MVEKDVAGALVDYTENQELECTSQFPTLSKSLAYVVRLIFLLVFSRSNKKYYLKVFKKY